MKMRKYEIGSMCIDCGIAVDPRSYRCRSCRTIKLIKDKKINIVIPVEKRFWDNVIKTDNCWTWNGNKDENGYGRIGLGKKYFRTHRFSYELHNGKIKNGLWILHNCDNPSCVNPDHLKLGTHKDNQKDKSDRKRISGKRNPNYQHGRRTKK